MRPDKTLKDTVWARLFYFDFDSFQSKQDYVTFGVSITG